MPESELLTPAPLALVSNPEIPALLTRIRPAWQAKDLILRVRRLVAVDPSSACQRLFNASIHDLKEKITIAGLDIAKEAALQSGLPPINRVEDVEEYATSKLIDLAYRMGLLSRPEWRRVSRCYEIRRDLEHEDNEYEAGIEDCMYIFNTCTEVILSKDPIHLLRVSDVKEVIEQPQAVFPSQSLLNDFQHAPQLRQEEIAKFLMAICVDAKQSEIVRQNAFTLLRHLQPLTQNAVKLKLSAHLQDQIGRKGLNKLHMRVAHAAGALPYLKQSDVADFFQGIYQQMEKVTTAWSAYEHHGDLLRSLKEIGGLLYCPPGVRQQMLKWLSLTFIGQPGGLTRYGHVRNVFYSDSAAPIIEELVRDSRTQIRDDLKALENDNDVKTFCRSAHIARRFQLLLDVVNEP